MKYRINGRKTQRRHFLVSCVALMLALALVATASFLSPIAQGNGPYVTVDKTATAYNITCGQEFLVTLIVNGTGLGGPLDVMLVIDRSDSMEGEPLDAAKAAAKVFIDNRTFTGDPATSDWVGIASYATTASLDQGLTNNSNTAKLAIDGLSAVYGSPAEGYTNIMAGVHVAQEELATHGRPYAVNVMVVLSDGVGNRWTNFGTGTTYSTATWPVGHTTSTSKAIGEAKAAKDAGTIVFTIGLNLALLGDSEWVARDTLKQMATSLDHFFDAATPGYLEEIYAIIAIYYVGPSATNLTLTDIVEDEFIIVGGSINPPPTSLVGNTITWNFSILGSETKIFQYKIRPKPGLAAGLYSANVKATLNYTDHEENPASLTFPVLMVEVYLEPYTPAPQRLWTTNSSGLEEIDEFLIGEWVYLKTADDFVGMPLVPGKYRVWLFEGNIIPFDGMPIPGALPELGLTPFNVTAIDGRFGVPLPEELWEIPMDPDLICHNFTVILDQLEVGLGEVAVEAPNIGFWGDEDYRDDLCTRKPTPPSFHVIPEVALGTIMILVSMFGSLGYYFVRKKRNQNLQ